MQWLVQWEREPISGATDGCAGSSGSAKQGFRNQADDRQGLQGMWQRHADQEGRLRVLHQLRNDRGVRLRLDKRVSGNM